MTKESQLSHKMGYLKESKPYFSRQLLEVISLKAIKLQPYKKGYSSLAFRKFILSKKAPFSLLCSEKKIFMEHVVLSLT